MVVYNLSHESARSGVQPAPRHAPPPPSPRVWGRESGHIDPIPPTTKMRTKQKRTHKIKKKRKPSDESAPSEFKTDIWARMGQNVRR